MFFFGKHGFHPKHRQPAPLMNEGALIGAPEHHTILW